MRSEAARKGRAWQPALSADVEQYLVASYAHNTREA
jgi:hypothetical protein